MNLFRAESAISDWAVQKRKVSTNKKRKNGKTTKTNEQQTKNTLLSLGFAWWEKRMVLVLRQVGTKVWLQLEGIDQNGFQGLVLVAHHFTLTDQEWQELALQPSPAPTAPADASPSPAASQTSLRP